jgi:hypothetical protein
MARVQFSDVFVEGQDGRLECRQRTCIAGTTLSLGTRFTKGSSFSGVNISQYSDHDLEIKIENDVLFVKGVHSPTGVIPVS